MRDYILFREDTQLEWTPNGYDFAAEQGKTIYIAEMDLRRAIAIAMEHGWTPKGTHSPERFYNLHGIGVLEDIDWKGHYIGAKFQYVDEEDARNLGIALEKSLPVKTSELEALENRIASRLWQFQSCRARLFGPDIVQDVNPHEDSAFLHTEWQERERIANFCLGGPFYIG